MSAALHPPPTLMHPTICYSPVGPAASGNAWSYQMSARNYEVEIHGTEPKPAVLFGDSPSGPPRMLGPAFTVTLLGDLASFQASSAGSKLDLATESAGLLRGVAIFPARPPLRGPFMLAGTSDPLYDLRGRWLVAGEILIDENGHLSEIVACDWNS